MQNFFQRFLYGIAFALGIALSVKSLREPDLWWQIRTGQWIMQHGQVPLTDPFSFSKAGTEWINIKWGFEVLAAWIAGAGGPESVFLLQLICTTLILYVLYRILKLYAIREGALFFVSTVLLLAGIEFRIIGRPEMISHLMVMIYAYLLLSFHEKRSKSILLLIPLQILWTNMHEAYALGIVMCGIYTVAAWIRSFRFNTNKPYKISLVTLLCIASLCVNPRGTTLLIRPFNIFSQVQENKYTTELGSVFSEDFWQKEAFYLLVLALAFLYLLFRYRKQFMTEFKLLQYPAEYLLICLAFLGLAFTAYRNIVFFVLLVIPVLASGIAQHLPGIGKRQVLLSVCGVCLYLIIVSGTWYRWVRPRDRFGMEVLSTHNPVGAAQHIAAGGLDSSKGFADYLVSSYLLWRLQPSFKTYIDLRDLDVFPPEFFDEYLGIINDPEKFHALDLKENFRYVVLYRLSPPALHHYLYTDSVYACTFADPVAAVYEKTDHFTRTDIFSDCKAVEIHTLPMLVNKILNPFFKPFDENERSFDLEAAQYYFNVGMPSLAERRINRYLQLFPADEQALQLRNQIMNMKGKINF